MTTLRRLGHRGWGAFAALLVVALLPVLLYWTVPKGSSLTPSAVPHPIARQVRVLWDRRPGR